MAYMKATKTFSLGDTAFCCSECWESFSGMISGEFVPLEVAALCLKCNRTLKVLCRFSGVRSHSLGGGD